LNNELLIVLSTAIGIGILHTATGPDHYLPFIALAKARDWSLGKTIFWVLACGCGHVWSSVLLGLGGVALGWGVSKIEWIEGLRGGAAGWALFLFGILYCSWGLLAAAKNKRHKHFDTYENGDVYVFEHKHGQAVAAKDKHKVTPWVMFIIFLLGPCEPMIPLLFVPAAQNSIWGMAILVTTYTLVTLATMLLMVGLGFYGWSLFKTEKLERYVHALGGFTILLCGTGMIFLGW